MQDQRTVQLILGALYVVKQVIGIEAERDIRFVLDGKIPGGYTHDDGQHPMLGGRVVGGLVTPVDQAVRACLVHQRGKVIPGRVDAVLEHGILCDQRSRVDKVALQAQLVQYRHGGGLDGDIAVAVFHRQAQRLLQRIAQQRIVHQ